MAGAVDREPRRHPEETLTVLQNIKEHLREDIEKIDEGHHWLSEFGELKSDQIKLLKELEAEITRLRRAIADLRLDKLFLQEAVRASPSLYNE
jgi:hypothetical protein